MARKHAEGADGSPAGVSRPDPVAAKAAAIKAGQARPPTWQTVIKRLLVLAIAGVAIYLVLPSLLAVLGSWPRLSALRPVWFAVALAAELASFTCNFAVQRLALRTRGWFAILALFPITPGGTRRRGGEPQRPAVYWAVGVIAAVLFLASLLAHELAHALVARRSGVTVKSVTLWMLGGMTEFETEPPSSTPPGT